MALTRSETFALEALRTLASQTPGVGRDIAKQTMRVWSVLNIGEKATHFQRVREVCENVQPSLKQKEKYRQIELALEMQSRLYIA